MTNSWPSPTLWHGTADLLASCGAYHPDLNYAREERYLALLILGKCIEYARAADAGS